MYSMSGRPIICKECHEQNFTHVEVSFGTPFSADGSGLSTSGEKPGTYILSICNKCTVCVLTKSDSWHFI